MQTAVDMLNRYISFICTGPATGSDVNSAHRTESIVFWIALQCSNEPPQETLCTRGLAIVLKGRQWVSVCPCCLSGQKFKKYSTKTANTLISLFAKGAVKLSPLIPHFPSRLIIEEIAFEEAMMSKGLLIIQRPLYHIHILHKKTFPECLSNSLSRLRMNRSDCNPGSTSTTACRYMEGCCSGTTDNNNNNNI